MRKQLIVVLVVLMAGCASLPPTIDQGEYQNYRYGFIVRLPDGGWVMTKTIPESFSAYLVAEAPERVLLLLYNAQTRKFANPQTNIAVWVGAFRLNIGSATTGSLNLSEVLPIDDLQGQVDQGLQNVESAQANVDGWWNGLTPLEQQNPANRARYAAANRALESAGELLTGLDGALNNAESATVQYSLEKSQKEMWNFIVGAQFQLNQSGQFRAEYGFLGTRQQFIGMIQYRFGL